MLLIDSPAAAWDHIRDLVDLPYADGVRELDLWRDIDAVALPHVEIALRAVWLERYGLTAPKLSMVDETAFDAAVPEPMIMGLHWQVWEAAIDRLDGEAILAAAGVGDAAREHCERLDAEYSRCSVGVA